VELYAPPGWREAARTGSPVGWGLTTWSAPARPSEPPLLQRAGSGRPAGGGGVGGGGGGKEERGPGRLLLQCYCCYRGWRIDHLYRGDGDECLVYGEKKRNIGDLLEKFHPLYDYFFYRGADMEAVEVALRSYR
jgi:hypothetical protein